ncbi:uncharacterized protein LOC133821101 [Humulus lupulus]|uniref:uncharacterized protein LOC133821101 n=1 Tax=Humulus lupulus TaxID=3486 RepID=UPI002B407F20|nr:uncharacterized protein LOC133821101 [Humulus lupulus]
MEGLIPLVYRAIKKNRTRRQYECLSSGTAAAPQGYNIADFYVSDHHNLHHQAQNDMMMKSGHRRHNSVGEYAFGSFSTPGAERDYITTSTTPTTITAPKRARLVRFTSHRMFTFSCVTGAA